MAWSEWPGFSPEPSDFRLYVPRLLSVASGRPMAVPIANQEISHREVG